MRSTSTTLRAALLLTAFLFDCGAALAQSGPIGLWRNFDDDSGKPRAEIRITETGGVLSGRIVRSLAPDPAKEEPNCSKCSDDRKGQPIAGLEIIRGAKSVASSGWWEEGTILDPDNGKTYRLKLRANDDGKTLLIRGFIGPFYRTQTWERVQ